MGGMLWRSSRGSPQKGTCRFQFGRRWDHRCYVRRGGLSVLYAMM